MGTSIGRGIVSTTTSAWTRQIASLVLYMTAARLLQPSEIGLFALAAAIVLLLEYAVFDSISEAVVQRADLDRHHIGAALFLSALCGLAIAVAGVTCAGAIESALGMPGLGHLIRIMALSVGFMCLSAVHAGLLRRDGQFHEIALIAGGAGLGSALLGAALLMSGAGLTAMLTYFAVEKVSLCLMTVWVARAGKFARFGRSHVTTLIPYATAVGAQRMVFYARNQADRLVIGVVWGADILGIYQIAARIFDSLQAILLAPASKLFFVSFARLQRDPVLLRESYVRSLQTVSLIAYPSFLGLSAIASDAVTLLFGAKWNASAILLEILALGGLALVVSVMSGAALSATGRARTFLTVEIASTVIGLTLLIALSRFGPAWIAAAFILRETIAVVLYLRILGPLLKVRAVDPIATIIPSLCASVVMWSVLFVLPFDALGAGPTATLIVKVMVAVPCYGALMLLFGRPAISAARHVFRDAPRVLPENKTPVDV